MKHYQYLIVGGGLSADAAVRGIRSLDTQGSIGLLSNEQHGPYSRPELSKGLWKGKAFDTIWRHTEDLNATLHLGRKVVLLEKGQNRLYDDKGDGYTYDKLLLATGGTPNHLPFGHGEIIYYRGVQDYLKLRSLCESGTTFLVIGGGFIGSEVAAALSMIGKKVILIFPEAGIGSRVFPEDLSLFLQQYYQEKGVEVISGESVVSVHSHEGISTVRTSTEKSFTVDGVVAGIGIHPNIALAEQAVLDIDNGITVNEYLQSSHPNIYAAGDVANFMHGSLHKRVRLEHEDNALAMGKQAGRNMAGAQEAYTYAPMFYSDLFDLGYEAVGELDSRNQVIADWKEPYKKGVLYYLNEEKVQGVLLWNVWDTVDKARELLLEERSYTKKELIGRL